jgi:hypothetical protein
VLRFAFAPALGWAFIVAFAKDMDRILQMNPVPEGSMLHGLLELAAFPGIVAVVGLCCLFVYRYWSGFLLLERRVSWLSVVWRLLMYTPLAFIMTGIVFFLVQWLFVVGSEDPAGPQYGLSAWVAGYYYAIMLTPPMTVIWVWWSLKRKYKG